MFKKVTRHIPAEVTRDLWLFSGGRCQFRGCNKILYRSPVTQEKVNRAQRAHIYSFSKDGPRGRGPHVRKTSGLNSTKNLMLVCHGCHQLIDRDKPGAKYSAELLQEWKREHEIRIERVTGVSPKRKSHIVVYRSRIGVNDPSIDVDEVTSALFPAWYPASDQVIDLSPTLELEDNKDHFWETQSGHLKGAFERQVRSLAASGHAKHFSIFAFGDIPLLISLGALLTDQRGVEVYQLKREPQTWRHQTDAPRGFRFRIKAPASMRGKPVLALSCSGSVDRANIRKALKGPISIWELTVKAPYNDVMRSRAQLSLYRRAVRDILARVSRAHGSSHVHVFPALPLSCAVELGRMRLPKFNAPWLVYDFNHKLNGYIPTLTIGTP